MRSSLFLSASALAAFANAQLTTKCNPTKQTCPEDPAMPQIFETDFKAGPDAVKGWNLESGNPTYGPNGVELTVANPGEGPVLRTAGYFHFGKVEMKVKAAAGPGIVSSVVLSSADLDEVDWEWLGGEPDNVQMNYFGKGNNTTFDRMKKAAPAGLNTHEFHIYGIDWTKEKIDWIIDGQVVNTLKYEEAVGGTNFPQTPCTLGFGPWPAGDSPDQGTSDWAGGKVDWSKAPFTQAVEWVKITNYSPGQAYKWKDMSGSYESIEVIGAGDNAGSPTNSVTLPPASTGASHADPAVSAASPESTPCTTSATVPAFPESTVIPEPPMETPVEPPMEPETSTTCTTSATLPAFPESTIIPEPPIETPYEPPMETPVVPEIPSTTCTTSATVPAVPESTIIPEPPIETPYEPPMETPVVPEIPSTTCTTSATVPAVPESTIIPEPPIETYVPEAPPSTSCTTSATIPAFPESTIIPEPPIETPYEPPMETPVVPEIPSTTCTTSATVPAIPESTIIPELPVETPCDCGTSTVTIPSEPIPTTMSTAVIPPPEVTFTSAASIESVPPYPTAPGIKTETSLPPPIPSATGAITSGNATTPPIESFPGAASHNTAGALFGLVGAVMLLAF